MKKFLCPNCYKTVKSQDIEFRCTEQSCFGKEADEKYQKYLMSLNNNKEIQHDLLMGKVFRGRKGFFERAHLTGGAMPVAAKCPDCKTETTVRVCPRCHCELPENFDRVETLVFGVIGDRGVSKSTFIAVALNELEVRLAGNDLDADFHPAMEDVRNRYIKYYYNSVYKQRNTVGATPEQKNRDKADLDFKKPLIYTLETRNKKVNIVFFDIAGEECKKEELLKSAAQYLPHANGIICIIDPLYMEQFRNVVPEDLVKASSVISDEEAKGYRAKDLFFRVQDIVNPGGKVQAPVSIAVSKADLIHVVKEALPPGTKASQKKSELLVNGKFNKTECRQVSEEMQAFLEHYGQQDLVSFLKKNYQKYSYTIFSALGEAPVEVKDADGYNADIAEPHPVRIADSIYYLLHENHVI